MMGGHCIKTWSATQGAYALSSAEAELYAISTGAVEALGLAQLLGEWQQHYKPVLWSDSRSALAVCRKRGPGRI